MNILEPKIYSTECITKIEKPVLTKDNIPYKASLIFNAGVAKYKGKYVRLESPFPVYSRGGLPSAGKLPRRNDC